MTSSPVAITATAAVIRENGRYLITLRHASAHCGDLWEFPGGKVQRGESLEECLVREIKEELGIDIAVGGLLEKVSHCYPDRRVVLYFFYCIRLSGDPVALGCAAFRWVRPKQLGQLHFPEADRRFLNRLSGANKAALGVAERQLKRRTQERFSRLTPRNPFE